MRLGRICINWKVLVGLGLLGVAIWVFVPGMFLAALPILVLAVCPLSMLAMMWGMKHAMQPDQNDAHSPAPSPTVVQDAEQEARLADLKAQQSAIGREIAKIEQSSQRSTGAGEIGLSPNDGNSEGRP